MAPIETIRIDIQLAIGTSSEYQTKLTDSSLGIMLIGEPEFERILAVLWDNMDGRVAAR